VLLLGLLATLPIGAVLGSLFPSARSAGYMERGEYSPSLYLALRLAAYFEVPVEVIFSTEPFPRIGSAGMSAS
jgi:DNA-binding XRE family transcriptional regulator